MNALANTLLQHAKAATKEALKFQGTERQKLEQWRKAHKAYTKVADVYWKQGIAGLKKSGDGLGERPIKDWVSAFDKESGEGYTKYSEEASRVAKVAAAISNKLPLREGEVNEFGWAAKPVPSDSSAPTSVWEVYERDGTGCLIYMYEEDARACDFFENGYDKIVKANVGLSVDEIKTLKERKPIYIS